MRGMVIGLALFASGCAQDRVGQGASRLVGGNPTSDYPAVLFLQSPDGGYCTGTLVAPDVVLTAARCELAPGWTATVMSSYEEPIAAQDVVEVVFHRYWVDREDVAVDHDLSLARLAGELPVEPLPFVTAPLDDYPLGETVIAVGFGVDDGVALTGGGVKRVGAFPITWATTDYLVGRETGTSVCYGDSGGPALLNVDGVANVVGVASRTAETCRRDSGWTRVDTYAAEFVTPFVDAWSGPCRLDGACVNEGCRTPDPDCAPCGVDGSCSAGCEQLDLDCPVAGVFGDPCGSPDDCESRLCTGESDQDGFCTHRCDQIERFCPSGLVCEERAGANVCLAEEEEGGCAAGGRTSSGWLAVVALLAGVSRRACSRGRRRRRRCPGTA